MVFLWISIAKGLGSGLWVIQKALADRAAEWAAHPARGGQLVSEFGYGRSAKLWKGVKPVILVGLTRRAGNFAPLRVGEREYHLRRIMHSVKTFKSQLHKRWCTYRSSKVCMAINQYLGRLKYKCTLTYR